MSDIVARIPTPRRLLALSVVVAALFGVPTLAAAAPTGYVAYEPDEEIEIGTVDLGVGAPTVTNVGSTGLSTDPSIAGVALAPSGVLYALESEGDTLYSLNPATGAITGSVTLDFDLSNSQPVVTSDGRVFALSGNGLREVNLADGTTVLRATLPSGVQGVAARCIDAAGTNQVFVLSAISSQLYRVDLPSFTVTTLPQTLGAFAINSPKIGFDAAGTLWALSINVVNPIVFTIDTTTGAGTTVGSSGPLGARGLAIVAPTCPAAPPTPPAPPAPVPVSPTFTG